MTGASCPKKYGLRKSHLTIEITQPVELQYRPFLKRGWVIFRLARSIVTGPRSIVSVQLPYRLQGVGNLMFRDCLMGKPVRSWPKLRNDGQIFILLHDLSKEPMRVTPRMGVLMIETTDVAIITTVALN